MEPVRLAGADARPGRIGEPPSMVFLSAGTATRALGQDESRRDRIGMDVVDGTVAEREELGSNILH
jgi:hypothetical protein